ncbi:RNA polymerase I subunit F [Rhynchophorus ferrugineus]|uniref:RPA43 OB domain-containing protein n=1 Tax=Rhynchophorus ferrugineus TaxID=354439 RepID=A0A834HZ70_RHYFE|nr:hypothetical protein GWI33_016895 [Rhynchophorus ferrugineus]
MTRFNAFQIKFEPDFLNTLVQNENNGVSKNNCQYHLALHPAQLGDFGQSIKDELGKRTAKYDKNVKGVLLGFENVKLNSHLGTIGLDNCYIHIDVRADFYVFLPKKGMILQGMVTKTSKDHVGCLLYNTFNVSLPKGECTPEEWLGDKVKIGNEIEFEITFVDLESRLVYIRAKLLNIINTNENAQFVNAFTKTKTPNKKIKFDLEENVITDSNNLEETVVKPAKKKKSKKDKKQEQNPEEIVTKKEKRKKKKRDDDEQSLPDLDIKSLFDGVSIDVTASSETMVNKEDTRKRKRSKSLSLDNGNSQKIKLELT